MYPGPGLTLGEALLIFAASILNLNLGTFSKYVCVCGPLSPFVERLPVNVGS